MNKVNILIADSGYLSRKGLSALLAESDAYVLVGEAENSEILFEKVKLYRPDILVIDFSSECFIVDDIQQVVKKFPKTKVLAITPLLHSALILKAFEAGAVSYLLKDCDKEEINEALVKTALGNKFVCGKVLDKMMSVEKEQGILSSSASCEGVNITTREMEIIRLIAEGCSNKQVAEKLFLSTHTVTTHRKNIMNKLGVNNTAGLVLFAVREHLLNPNKFLFS